MAVAEEWSEGQRGKEGFLGDGGNPDAAGESSRRCGSIAPKRRLDVDGEQADRKTPQSSASGGARVIRRKKSREESNTVVVCRSGVSITELEVGGRGGRTILCGAGHQEVGVQLMRQGKSG